MKKKRLGPAICMCVITVPWIIVMLCMANYIDSLHRSNEHLTQKYQVAMSTNEARVKIWEEEHRELAVDYAELQINISGHKERIEALELRENELLEEITRLREGILCAVPQTLLPLEEK